MTPRNILPNKSPGNPDVVYGSECCYTWQLLGQETCCKLLILLKMSVYIFDTSIRRHKCKQDYDSSTFFWVFNENFLDIVGPLGVYTCLNSTIKITNSKLIGHQNNWFLSQLMLIRSLCLIWVIWQFFVTVWTTFLKCNYIQHWKQCTSQWYLRPFSSKLLAMATKGMAKSVGNIAAKWLMIIRATVALL